MVSVKNLLKIYKTGADSVRAVDGVTLDVSEHEFFVLLGLSGSGKTTLLRCVAGLEKPDGGEIGINAALVSSAERGFFTAPENRGLGMVFQSYAVWPHMTVFQNVGFPMINGPHKVSSDDVKKKSDECARARPTRRACGAAGAVFEWRPAAARRFSTGPCG